MTEQAVVPADVVAVGGLVSQPPIVEVDGWAAGAWELYAHWLG